MKLRNAAILLALSSAWLPAHASLLTNGNFETCDLSGWTTDSDGMTGNTGDFTIIDNGDGCSARIFIDQSDSFANTLFQSIDTSQLTNAPLTLRYDFSVNSELTGQAPLSADYFTIGLGDGSGMLFNAQGVPGSLFDQPDIDGEMRYTGEITLDSVISDWQALTLEIQLISNFDMNPAWLTVNSFALDISGDEISVPTPATFPLLLCALGMLHRRRALRKQEI